MRVYSDKKNYSIPSFAVSEFGDSKKTLKARFQSIFEEDKKKRGLVIISIVLIVAILTGSLFIFGGKDVKQINDSLTVYIRGIDSTYRNTVNFHEPVNAPLADGYYTDPLIADYKQEYPNVKLNAVDLSKLTEEQFYDKLSSEIMAGSGPDVIIGTEDFMKYRDVNKLIDSAVFAELDEFISSDPQKTFVANDCFDNIMEFGRHKGKTYVIPVNFDLPILYSPHQTLNNAEINIETCTRDYMGFAEEISKYISKIDGAENKSVFNNIDNITPFLNLMYEPEQYDKDTFRKFAEMYKPIYEYDTSKDKIVDEYLEFAYTNNSTLFGHNWANLYDNNKPVSKLVNTFIRTRSIDENPVVVTLNQPNGDFAANVTVFAGINANSANKQNAYNYIKMLAGAYNSYYTHKRFLSTNKLAFTQVLSDYISDKYSWNVPEKDMTFNYPAYTKEDISNTIKFIETINAVYCKNPMTYETERIMTEYYKGTATLEDCLKQVDEKITIYRSE